MRLVRTTRLGERIGATGSRRRRSSVGGIAIVASAATICVGLAAPGGAAAATHPGHTAHFAKVGTHYAVTKDLCTAAPKPGYAACDAIRLVKASKNTPGARPYVVKTSFPVGPSGLGYTPGDFATAYDFNPKAALGATQTIGIVDAFDDPNILSDLNTFDTQYLSPFQETLGTTFEKVSQTGSTTALPAPDTSGWSGEEALDVETARGVCNLCKIILVEAKTPSDANLAAGVKEAVKLGATEVSNSYGGPEDPNWSAAKRSAYEKLYKYPGVVVTASTGDEGWFSWDNINNDPSAIPSSFAPSAEAPNVPSTLPSVVAVGGTSLNLKGSGARSSESVWNGDGPADSAGSSAGFAVGASGGGCSVLYKAQGWQSHVPGYAKTGCGKMRLAADVSADADPATGYDFYTSYDCGGPCAGFGAWEPIGGTSLSSPLIASMWALAGGAGGVAYPSLSLYGHAVSATPPLYDVKTGGNSWCDKDATCAHDTNTLTGASNPNDLCLQNDEHKCVVNLGTLDCGFVRTGSKPTLVADDHQCNAAAGYDGPSGVGTPNGLGLFTPLHPKAKIHPPSTIRANTKAKFTGGGHDPFPGGTFVSFVWKWGDGHHSTVSTASHDHVYSKSGTYTVTLTVTDGYGQTATTTQSVTVHKK